MIASLRETKAKLSAFVSRAEKGEDVVITVRGKPSARLTCIRPRTAHDYRSWIRDLTKLQRKYSTSRQTLPAEKIIDQLREERR